MDMTGKKNQGTTETGRGARFNGPGQQEETIRRYYYIWKEEKHAGKSDHEQITEYRWYRRWGRGTRVPRYNLGTTKRDKRTKYSRKHAARKKRSRPDHIAHMVE